MFIGTYNCKIDDKGRMIIPKEIRINIKENAKITFVDDTSFIIKDSFGWKIDEVFEYKASYVNQSVAENSYESKIDSQGRIQLPIHVLNKIHIGKDVVVTGEGDFIGVTDYNKYLEYQEHRKTI